MRPEVDPVGKYAQPVLRGTRTMRMLTGLALALSGLTCAACSSKPVAPPRWLAACTVDAPDPHPRVLRVGDQGIIVQRRLCLPGCMAN
jgi:hypothetical protein